MTDSAHILVVDNYDSFCLPIVGYLQNPLAPLLMWCVTTLSTQPRRVYLDGYDGVLIFLALALRPNPVLVRIWIRLCEGQRGADVCVCLVCWRSLRYKWLHCGPCAHHQAWQASQLGGTYR